MEKADGCHFCLTCELMEVHFLYRISGSVLLLHKNIVTKLSHYISFYCPWSFIPPPSPKHTHAAATFLILCMFYYSKCSCNLPICYIWTPWLNYSREFRERHDRDGTRRATSTVSGNCFMSMHWLKEQEKLTICTVLRRQLIWGTVRHIGVSHTCCVPTKADTFQS